MITKNNIILLFWFTNIKITEITILQKDTSDNSNAIRDLNTRLRQIEIDLAKHHAEDKKNG